MYRLCPCTGSGPLLLLKACQHMPRHTCRTCRGPVLKARKRFCAPPPGLAGGEALDVPTGCCSSGLAGGETLGGEGLCAPAGPRKPGLAAGEGTGGGGCWCALSACTGQYGAVGSSHRSCSKRVKR